MTDDVILRPYCPADRELIEDSWLKSYYSHASCWMGWVSVESFCTLYMPIIRALLDRSRVRVACLRDSEPDVVGWAVLSDKLLHYVWVRDGWRRDGLGTWLVADLAPDAMRYTHETEAGRAWVKRFPGWTSAPRELRKEAKCVL